MKNDSKVPRLCNRQRASKPRYFGYVLTSESGDKPQTSLLPKSSQIGFQWLIDVIVGKCAYEQWCIQTASNTFSSPIVQLHFPIPSVNPMNLKPKFLSGRLRPKESTMIDMRWLINVIVENCAELQSLTVQVEHQQCSPQVNCLLNIRGLILSCFRLKL